MSQLPELLAPAGDLESALTAYKYGADAVYCGLGRFNAREMAKNFSFSEMSKLSEYAKKRDKKYYLTFNTLIKQSELPSAYKDLEQISSLDPDGVIVQDLGILKLIKQYFPRIPVHASTQMGIHNSAGVKTAERLGISRVILERQVTTEELRSIVSATDAEIEVFIHGALCCSLSGMCLFSSWFGGWSGNRGRCKQPCRRRFHALEGDEKHSGFLFSTQDLYSLDLVPQYVEMGIASLKIEGRLKKPDYIRSVVSAYRIALDSGGDRKALGEAKQILAGSFGRRWSHGFASKQDMESLIQYDSLGVSGLLVGDVKQAGDKWFSVEVSRPIFVGDRLRVQGSTGDEAPSFTIRTMRKKSKHVSFARKGELVSIGYSGEVPDNAKVFKVGESRNPDSFSHKNLALYQQKEAVDLEIAISSKMIRIVNSLSGVPAWEKKLDLEEAQKHSLDTQTVENMFRSTRSDKLQAGVIQISIDGDYFFPLRELKQLRREFWNWFLQEYEEMGTETISAGEVTEKDFSFSSARKHVTGKSAAVCEENPVSSGDATVFYSIDVAREGVKNVILPEFCPEDKLENLGLQIRNVYEKGARLFRITSLYQLSLFDELPEAILLSSFPLPVTNSLTAKVLMENGISQIQAWVELGKESIAQLCKASPLPCEMYVYGRPAILETRAAVPAEGEISDSRGKHFFVSSPDRYGLTRLFPKEVLSVPCVSGAAEFRDFCNAEIGESETSEFNYTRGLT